MKELPIRAKEDVIVATLLDRQVIIIEGETGSGKTTQVPIFLYEAGFSQQGTIGVTQPRRFAATSVAYYVASLSGKPMGDIVGYQVRFDRASDPNTAIKFMTAGILLRELLSDPQLLRYSVIMVDEAHERTEEMDLLLGLLKGVIAKRKNLYLIIASATIDTKKFSEYFGGVPIIKVSGKVYPVQTHYLKEDIDDLDYLFRRMAEKVIEIRSTSLSGHILVFVPGKQDVHQVINEIQLRKPDELVTLPLYGGMEPEDQGKAFVDYGNIRKVIVATNIAETSVTVDGVVYVVDSGLIKESDFNSDNGVSGLDIIEHSQAGCDQRKGRAGRTRSGICYRMYTEENFGKRRSFTRPEILRTKLTNTVLSMASLGITNPEAFEFIDPPETSVIRRASEELVILGALDRRRNITRLGLQMASLPMDPVVAKMLLDAREFGCLKEMITIAAFLSVPHAIMCPKGLEQKADEMHRQFINEQSDLLTYLNIWLAFKRALFNREWCKTHFLNQRALWEIQSLRQQLKDKFRMAGVQVTSSSDHQAVMKCIVGGLKYNILECRSDGYFGLFKDVRGVKVHPTSVLKKCKARFIVMTDIIETREQYARNCTIARIEWLAEFLPHIFASKKAVFRSYKPGDYHVVGEQVIVFRGKPVGTRVVNIPLEKAKDVLNGFAQKAEEKGLVKLVFEKKGESLVSSFEGRFIEMSLRSKVRVEPGVAYQCKLTKLGEAVFAEAQSIVPTLK